MTPKQPLTFAILPVIAVSIAALPLPECPAQAGWSRESWLRHQAAQLQDRDLIRWYTFEGVTTDQPGVRNLAGENGDLSFSVVPGDAGPAGGFEFIDGRWPGAHAVRLDRGRYSSDPFHVTDRSFTVQAWLRPQGMGSVKGDPIATGGTLLSLGGGYWDGWRITIRYPEASIGFEIGRPKPSSAAGIRTGPVTDGVWHHLAATWDGQSMCLYIDGMLAASGEYSGDFTQPEQGRVFRIGVAGFGWGAALCDFDQVAVYSRALSASEIVDDMCFHEHLSEAIARQFDAAQSARLAGDQAAALASYRRILDMQETPTCVGALARLQLAELLLAQGHMQDAARQLENLARAPDLPGNLSTAALRIVKQATTQIGGLAPELYRLVLHHGDRLQADELVSIRLNLAVSLARSGREAQAREEFAKLLATENLSPQQRLETQLDLAHAAARAGAIEEAGRTYRQIAKNESAPAHYRSYARICMAQTYRQQGDISAAKSAYREVAQMEDAPEHHRWEATQGMKELDRMDSGLPAHDPDWSRTQLPERPEPGMRLYLSPQGDDANPGSADEPLATMAAARDKIRSIKAAGGLPGGGVEVVLAPGEYPADETLHLQQQDSGTESAPIIYRAGQKGTARICGGVRIRAFEPVEDEKVLARIPDDARDHVVRLDLSKQGITDLGKLQYRGYGRPAYPILELFFDGEPMHLARWPNDGFVRTGEIVDTEAEGGGITFHYQGDRPSRWLTATDPWVFGYWRHLWADNRMEVQSIDTEAGTITTATAPHYGILPNHPYYVFNLLEELDQPGEWYLDRDNAVLYVYPPSDAAEADVRLSMLSEPFVRLDNVSRVTLEGLVFEYGRSNGIEISGGSNCLLAGCEIRRMGGDGVLVSGGDHHGILACDLAYLGRGGARVAGGDRKTLAPAHHFVENCHIHHFSRIDRTYTPAVHLDGVGNRIAHNLMHHTSCHAMRIEGNEQTIEFNEVHHAVTESDDQGGLDMWGDPTYRGNVIRYNLWHDIGGGAPMGQAGIRLDDAICGVLVYGNVFSRCSNGHFGAVQIHGGKENVVANNIFADCLHAISFSPWGEDRWHSFLNSDRGKQKTRQQVDISQPPYSTRYPALARLAEDPDVNKIWRNIVYNCGDFMIRDRDQQNLMDNQVVSQNPGFADPDNLDFRLKEDAAGLPLSGFRPIPFEQIGPYTDTWRTELPETGAAD